MRKSFFIALLITVLCVHCSTDSHWSRRKAAMQKTEEIYRKVFTLENKIGNVTEEHIRWNNKCYSGADLEGEPCLGWLSIVQQDLLWALKTVNEIDKHPQKVRINLMKRFGIVSSLVKIPRSAAVANYMSRPDAHAFSMEELDALFSSDKPAQSNLLRQMLADPHLFDGSVRP